MHSDLHELQQAQSNDPELPLILNGSLLCTPVLALVGDIYFHASNKAERPYIPISLRHTIFERYHSLAHPGIRATTKYLASKYFWPSMNKQIREWTRTCVDCQRAKIVRHNSAPIQSIPPASSKFSEIHLDLVGPLPINKNCRYLLTIIDRFSRWTEVIPITDMTAETVAHNFLLHWVARYGVPQTVTTDRGGQFESNLWRQLMIHLGSSKLRTTSFHPQANGLIERFHRRLKDALRAHADSDAQSWINKLPFIMLSLRTALREDAPVSPAQTIYGTALTLPSDLILPYKQGIPVNVDDYTNRLTSYMQFVPPATTRNPPYHSQLDKSLKSCTHVFVRNNTKKGLQQNYKGPYKILTRNNKYFILELPAGPDTISIDRLKAAHLAEEYLFPPVTTPPPVLNPQPNNPPIINPQPMNPLPMNPPPVANPPQPPAVQHRTRSGRNIRRPAYLNDFV